MSSGSPTDSSPSLPAAWLRRWVFFVVAVGGTVVLARCGGSSEQAMLQGDGVAVQDVALPDREGTGRYTPTLDGPLRVLSASPAGALRTMRDRPPIAVTFSKPMVALGETPPIPPNAIQTEPAVPGSLRWEGTQTLVFEPAQDLPMATEMKVILQAEVTSLDQETLREPFSWAFETPRPRLLSSDPAHRSRYLATGSSIALDFSLPIDAAQANNYVSIDGPPRGTYAIESGGDSTLVLRPRRSVPPGTDVTVTLRAGLPTTAGPLGMAEDDELRFRIRPKLDLADLDQRGLYGRDRRFYPNRALDLSFTTPVSFGALREAIAFEPSVEWPEGVEAQDGNVDTGHSLPVKLDPETRYLLTIDGLRDRFGQELYDVTQSFSTREIEPTLWMENGLMVIEADQYPVVPVRGTNAGAVQLGLDPLTADDLVPALRTYDQGRYYGRAAPGQPERDLVPATRRWALGMTRNEPALVPLRLDSMLTDGVGAVGVNLTWDDPASDQDRDFRALAQVTRLGLTAKFSPHENLVFVSRLSDATPVRGATVEVRDADNTVRWTGQTDAQGRARTPGWSRLDMIPESKYRNPVQYVVVKHQGDLAITSSLFDEGVEPYRFGLNYDWTPEAATETGTVFSDRGLYRTGDTVYLKGILRRKTDADWQSITDSVRVLIRDARDELVADRRLEPSDIGTFDLSYTIPGDAAQGPYEVRVATVNDTTVTANRAYQRGGITTGTFRVDAFRRATFAVDATSAADAYVAGDFFEGTISGRYLFGSGMAGQPVTYRLTQSDTRYRPPGYSGYRFGPSRGSVYETLTREETRLDTSSMAKARVQLPGNASGAPTRLEWSGTVTSPARQTLSGQTPATLHPGLYYIGLKAETTFLDLSQDTTLSMNVVTVDPEGQVLAGNDVTVDLVRVQWNSVREVGADGRLRWRSERTEEVVRSATVTSSSTAARQIIMDVPGGGYYQVQARSQDLRGNEIRTDTYAYATGRGYVAWQRDDDDRIDLVPERTDYAPGETAKLLVKNPFEEATALITVEREGILSSRVETLTGSAPQIEVPLDEAHIPNVYVSVILLNGRTAPPQPMSDPGAPGFKIGYASLRVDPNRKHLRVAVTPERTEVRPGEEVTVDLQLTDASGDGVRGEIAFAAADAGVLDLIGYALPDPFDTFYGPRPLGVTTSESRANLVEQRSYGQKAEATGGGGGAGRDMMRTDFRPLAHWAPAIQTDGSGRAQVTFRLPESLTTFRLMATALTADHAFGQGQTDVVVTKPLVLQQALPRFARLGDRFSAGVLVSNRTGAEGSVTVEAESDRLSVDGPPSQTISLAAGATQEVRFDWQAAVSGDADIQFRATLNDERDAFRTTLPVSIPRTTLASATFASTDSTAREAFRVPAGRIPDVGTFDVKLSSTALVGLDGAVEYLFDYPYGCLEQQTSRIRPLLIAHDIVDAFDLKVLDGDRNGVTQEWIAGLPGFWTSDGFALWEGSTRASPYVTAYTVLALAEARDAGFAIPQALTADAVDALARMVRNRSDRPRYYSASVWTDTRAMMLFALARHGRVLESEIDRIASDPPQSAEGTSTILRAILAADHDALDRFRTGLAERLQNMIRVEGTRAYLDAPEGADYGWIFASDARATAFGLTALIENGAGEAFQPLAQRMIRSLMAERRNGHWASTQDNAAAVDAFRAYVDAYEQATPDFAADVQLAGRSILQQTFEGRGLEVAADTVGLDGVTAGREVPVTISKEGSGTLYYSLRLKTYTAEPVDARSQGIRVARTMQRLDESGETIGPVRTTGNAEIEVAPGDLVRVTLRVSTPTARNYVVVDDALPAGLETVNTAFATTDDAVLDAADAGQRRWWGSFNHTEQRDDRVLLFADYLREGEHTYTYVARAMTPGTFTHPPAQAEMMYEPETRGRTATGTLIVAPSPVQAGR